MGRSKPHRYLNRFETGFECARLAIVPNRKESISDTYIAIPVLLLVYLTIGANVSSLGDGDVPLYSQKNRSF